MELHAFDRQVAVAQAHDLAVLRLGAHRQAAGQRLALHGERVVARRDELVRNLEINPVAVVPDARQLAMHHLPSAHHPAAERLPDRLVPEADPEDRHAPRHAAYAEATSAALRMARALCCVSCHSDCGSESATMPAAACTCSRRSLITAVRIAIATSMSPLKPR